MKERDRRMKVQGRLVEKVKKRTWIGRIVWHSLLYIFSILLEQMVYLGFEDDLRWSVFEKYIFTNRWQEFLISVLIVAGLFIPAWHATYRSAYSDGKEMFFYVCYALCYVSFIPEFRFSVHLPVFTAGMLAGFTVLLILRFTAMGGGTRDHYGALLRRLPWLFLIFGSFGMFLLVLLYYAILLAQVLLCFLTALALIVVPVVIIRKTKAMQKSASAKKGVLVSIHDFYVFSPYRKKKNRFPYREIRGLIKEIPGLKAFGRILGSGNGRLGDYLIFYYKPIYAEMIPEADRAECSARIVSWLNERRALGENIRVICEDERYKHFKVDEWDFLSAALYRAGFGLRFERVVDEAFMAAGGQAGDRGTAVPGAGSGAEPSRMLSLAEREKFAYASSQLIECRKATDEAQAFYGLVKIVEYIMHYRGLYAISNECDPPGRFPSFSMGDWNNYQINELDDWKGRRYTDEKLLHAMSVARRAANQPASNSTSYGYDDICLVFVQLRNRYIGHGTMAYSVSKELLDALYTLVAFLLTDFQRDGICLKENLTVIHPTLTGGLMIPCISVENGEFCLLSYLDMTEDGGFHADYLCYQSGNVLSRGSVRRVRLMGNEEVRKNAVD